MVLRIVEREHGLGGLHRADRSRLESEGAYLFVFLLTFQFPFFLLTPLGFFLCIFSSFGLLTHISFSVIENE